MKFDVILTRREMNNHIPYAFICQTRYGARWNTAKRKRLWVEMFTEAERSAANTRLFRQAYGWHLGRGVPDEVRMCTSTYMLWQKLGEFCAML